MNTKNRQSCGQFCVCVCVLFFGVPFHFPLKSGPPVFFLFNEGGPPLGLELPGPPTGLPLEPALLPGLPYDVLAELPDHFEWIKTFDHFASGCAQMKMGTRFT